ncbi:Uncharacterised protein [Mycobacteroides abscessus]|nr:Uncharacterised protein [Mycobacteroides abscessus]
MPTSAASAQRDAGPVSPCSTTSTSTSRASGRTATVV